MITGKEPAMPCDSDTHGKPHTGLTIREEFAARFMTAIFASVRCDAMTYAQMIRESVEAADALINELNKEK